jgi:hypothetical protein
MVGTNKFDVAERGSTAVQVLEKAWTVLRDIIPEVPEAVITLVDVRSRKRVLGYFSRSTWRKGRGCAHEIAVSPWLIGDPIQLLATMLHEAAHAVLYECDKNGGVGSTRYYHTKDFRDQCVVFGLQCEFVNTRYGWSLTSFPKSGVPAKYKRVLKLLRDRMPAGTGNGAPKQRKGQKLPVSGHTAMICTCQPIPRTIYVSKSNLQTGDIVCMKCGGGFRQAQ